MMATRQPYPTNVTQCLAGLVARREHCLRAIAEQVFPPRSSAGAKIFGSLAIAQLALACNEADANADLRMVADWFNHPHPTGRNHRGESDFAAMKLCLAFHHPSVNSRLEDETREAIAAFFLTQQFDSIYRSENHALLFHASRYLMGHVYAGETFQAYGHTGAELAEEDRAWLDDFIRFRAERGWGEFDSANYLLPDWEALTCLYDYAPDDEMRRLSGMMLDLLLADMAVDTLRGMYCGAHGRIYPPQALDHAREGTYPLQYLYFGLGDACDAHRCLVDAVLSTYQPHPLVVDITLNRPEPYENRERKHLHKLSDVRPQRPLEGSIRKYTYTNPDFVLGCVQYQDPYPEDGTIDHWYAHHQQHQWDLSFATRTDARLFTHHPGDFNEHNTWTGDVSCGCGHFLQSTTALLALYDIPENQPMQYIHAFVPADAFDEMVEEDGVIFVRAGNAYAALTILAGYEWVVEGDMAHREVRSHHPRNGAVCEVAAAADFAGFADFRAEMLANQVTFEREAMRLTYRSHRAGVLTLDTRGTRVHNGQPLDLNYPTYDCPYVHSPWQSGVIELRNDDRRLALDFTRKRMVQ